MKLKTIVIDKSPRTRKLFRQLVEEFVAELEVLGEAESVNEAKDLVAGVKPDLLVVDQNEYGEHAATIQSWRQEQPMDLAILAHYHDLPAIPTNGTFIDIVSKPINVEGIRHLARTASSRHIAVHNSGSDAFLVPDMAQIGNQNSKIALPFPRGFKFVQLNEILFCSADRVYTDFTLKSGEQLTASRSLKYFEELLVAFGFHRVHSSFLVNLDHVREYIRGSSGKGGTLVLTDDQQVPVARGRKMELLEKFSIKVKEN